MAHRDIGGSSPRVQETKRVSEADRGAAAGCPRIGAPVATERATRRHPEESRSGDSVTLSEDEDGQLHESWRDDPQALKSYLEDHPDIERWSESERLALAQASERYRDDRAVSGAIRESVVASVNRAESLEDLPRDRAYQYLLDRHVSAPGKPQDENDPLARAQGRLQGFSNTLVDDLFSSSMEERKGDEGIQAGVEDFQRKIGEAVEKNPALARQLQGSLESLSKDPEIAEKLDDVAHADDNLFQKAWHGASESIEGVGGFLGDAVRWTARNTVGRAIDAGVPLPDVLDGGLSTNGNAFQEAVGLVDAERAAAIREERKKFAVDGVAEGAAQLVETPFNILSDIPSTAKGLANLSVAASSFGPAAPVTVPLRASVEGKSVVDIVKGDAETLGHLLDPYKRTLEEKGGSAAAGHVTFDVIAALATLGAGPAVEGIKGMGWLKYLPAHGLPPAASAPWTFTRDRAENAAGEDASPESEALRRWVEEQAAEPS